MANIVSVGFGNVDSSVSADGFRAASFNGSGTSDAITGANHQFTGNSNAGCPDNCAWTRIATNCDIWFSIGPASMNSNSGPDATADPQRQLIPAGGTEGFKVNKGDFVAVALAS